MTPDEYEFLEDELRYDATAWMDYASCLGLDPDEYDPVIFPDAKTRDNAAIRDFIDTRCEGCPVRDRCLVFGVETDSRGIWGGFELTPTTVRRFKKLHEESGSLTVDQVKEASRRSKP